MPINITQTTINPIVPANAGVNFFGLNAANSPVQLIYPATFVQTPYYLASAIITGNDTGFSGGVLIMPNAFVITQSVVCTITNVGEGDITIKDFLGTQIATIASGKTKLFMLLNQEIPTAGGEWVVVDIGQSVTPADASVLAGYGLLAIANKLNCFYKTTTYSAPFALTNSLDASLINWEGGNLTLNLDSIIEPIEGFFFLIKNSSTGNGVLTLAATDIDGKTSLQLEVNQSTFVIRNSATGKWYTVGLGAFPFSNVVKIDQYGLKLANGSAANPSLAFITQPTTGIYSQGIEDVSIASSGALVFKSDDKGVRIYKGNYTLGEDLLLEFANIFP